MNAAPAAESPIHEVLAGRFRVEAELGRGGMARVYRATDLTTNKPMALKLLRSGVASEKEAVARLRREGEVLTRLDHPAVVRIETFGMLPDGRLFLAMELLEGETLGARMRRGPMSPASLCPVVTGAAAGLAAAHAAGVVHRDLKPDNIFLCDRGHGQPEQVKLLDFGISKVVDYERLTRTGQILGTPRYMAPEQLAADHDLDGSVDIYAFGVILYEALAGRPPFVASSPSDLIVAVLHGKVVPLRSCRADIAPELEAIVMRAMARDSSARYETAHELAEAFVDVARPRSAKPKLRPGQRTKLVGSFVPGELPDADPSHDSSPGESGLRPGTFSALPQRPSPPARLTPPETRPSRPQAAAQPAAQAAARPAAQVAARPAAASPPRAYATPSAAGPYDETGPIELPMRSHRPILVLAALLAGGLTAALVLAILHFFFDPPPPPDASDSALPVQVEEPWPDS